MRDKTGQEKKKFVAWKSVLTARAKVGYEDRDLARRSKRTTQMTKSKKANQLRRSPPRQRPLSGTTRGTGPWAKQQAELSWREQSA